MSLTWIRPKQGGESLNSEVGWSNLGVEAHPQGPLAFASTGKGVQIAEKVAWKLNGPRRIYLQPHEHSFSLRDLSRLKQRPIRRADAPCRRRCTLTYVSPQPHLSRPKRDRSTTKPNSQATRPKELNLHRTVFRDDGEPNTLSPTPPSSPPS